MTTITMGQAALAFARREVGTKEEPAGSNTGPRIRWYRQVGQGDAAISPGPWCADFVTAMATLAGFRPRGWNVRYCPAWVAAARAGTQGLRIVDWHDVKAGDLALYDWQHDTISDHIGIVARRTGATSFEAVEGNTSVGNDSNGGMVMVRARDRSQVAAFIRLPGTVTVAAPKPVDPLERRLRKAGLGRRSITRILKALGRSPK